jgi:hypothetical protein
MSAAAGINLPWLAAQAALGTVEPATEDFTAGTMFVRISFDQIARLADYESLATAGSLVDRHGRFTRGD